MGRHLHRSAEPLEAARRFVSILLEEREAYLLLVDLWNQAVRDPQAAIKFVERHARLTTLIVGDYDVVGDSLSSLGLGAPALVTADAF